MDDSLAIFSGVNFIFGIIVALVVAILIGRDAESRGMSGFGWGLFSFLLCIVAVPVYLIVRKPRLNERR